MTNTPDRTGAAPTPTGPLSKIDYSERIPNNVNLADDLAPVAHPHRRPDAGERLDDAAVHAAVHDAVGLVEVGLGGPGRGHRVPADLAELDAEMSHERADDVVVEGGCRRRVTHPCSIPPVRRRTPIGAESFDKVLAYSQAKCRT